MNIARKKRIPDTRVHCCLYFISPTGHSYVPVPRPLLGLALVCIICAQPVVGNRYLDSAGEGQMGPSVVTVRCFPRVSCQESEADRQPLRRPLVFWHRSTTVPAHRSWLMCPRCSSFVQEIPALPKPGVGGSKKGEMGGGLGYWIGAGVCGGRYPAVGIWRAASPV